MPNESLPQEGLITLTFCGNPSPQDVVIVSIQRPKFPAWWKELVARLFDRALRRCHITVAVESTNADTAMSVAREFNTRWRGRFFFASVNRDVITIGRV